MRVETVILEWKTFGKVKINYKADRLAFTKIPMFSLHIRICRLQNNLIYLQLPISLHSTHVKK